MMIATATMIAAAKVYLSGKYDRPYQFKTVYDVGSGEGALGIVASWFKPRLVVAIDIIEESRQAL